MVQLSNILTRSSDLGRARSRSGNDLARAKLSSSAPGRDGSALLGVDLTQKSAHVKERRANTIHEDEWVLYPVRFVSQLTSNAGPPELSRG